MNVVTFRTPAEQAKGALSLPSPLNAQLLLLFPFVSMGVVHGIGMREPLKVFFLDASFTKVGEALLVPGAKIAIPARTEHVVELSTRAQPPATFTFLRAVV